jgi:hypothetical protein
MLHIGVHGFVHGADRGSACFVLLLCSYGDMVAHDLLWEGAQASSGNLAARYDGAVC